MKLLCSPWLLQFASVWRLLLYFSPTFPAVLEQKTSTCAYLLIWFRKVTFDELGASYECGQSVKTKFNK